MDETQARLRGLPAVDELLRRTSLAAVLSALPRPMAVEACRAALEGARARILAGESRGFDEADVATAARTLVRPSLRRVLNATGVVLHTNLGRAPLATRALERLEEIAKGYSALELDLASGERGSRYAHVVGLLTRLTGAESALVVNNGAAAALLALGALAQGREVVVSRGELVEIGGGFRVPDVLRQSGATLVEVGTTNRTRAADYESAIGPATGLLLKVHQSNFAVVGFTEAVATKELAALAHAKGLVLLEDLGSGALQPLHAEGLTSEPTVAQAIAAGADVVTFSGDKLLGGPQAGIIVGKKAAVERLEKHPLNRALRVDKLTVAALEATLELYRDGLADTQVPVRAMLAATPDVLRGKAEALRRALEARGVAGRIVETVGQVGGGSMPLATPRSFAIALDGNAERLSERLREGDPPVVARVSDGALLLDVRCLDASDLDVLAAAVAVAREGP
jgi:L-seryl-tRNA(Ser) seleniumtransferase